MKYVLGMGLGLIVALVAAYYTVAELGQEVVVLHRPSDSGEPDRVRLWIVDEGRHSWIHHGRADAPWIATLASRPVVTLERSGQARRYRATPDPEPAPAAP